MQSLLILGRQPSLGLAELESLYGSKLVRPAGSQAALVDVDPCLLAFDRLGGAIKFCKVLTVLDTIVWRDVERFLVTVSPGHSQTMPEGKMQLGLSLYDFSESIGQIEATGLTLKKAIRKTGRNVRLIPNKQAELNSAQVHHNHLTGPTGWELVFVKDGSKTIVAQTVKVQDIEAYTKRDQQRPKRDAKVGMLPPKLAQIIINLAVGKLPEEQLESICDIPAGQAIPIKLLNQTILDPFCGSGVILQEAALMGYGLYGSDLEQRMVDYTQANLDWLHTLYEIRNTKYALEVGDATNHSWPQQFDFVASESYLGRPFTTKPDPEVLNQTVSDCNLIIKKFLRNIHPQLQPGARLCLAIPAWIIASSTTHINSGQQYLSAVQDGSRAAQRSVLKKYVSSAAQANPQNAPTTAVRFKHLPLVDQIEDLGYNQVSFEHAGNDQLLYYRADQIVARQLLVVTRK